MHFPYIRFVSDSFNNLMLSKSASALHRFSPKCRTVYRRMYSSNVKKSNTIDSDINLPSLKDFSSLMADSHTEKRIKIILMEHALARMSCGNVPVHLSVADMHDLLECKTSCERNDLFDLFYIKETRKEFLKLKSKVEGSSHWEKEREFLLNSYEAADHIRYGYDHNCIHIYFDPEWIRTHYNFRLAQAAKFSQPLVFDFGYEEYMTKRECLTTATLVQEAYIENRRNKEPFDLLFSNYNKIQPEHILVSEVNKLVKLSSGMHSMVTKSEKNYSDLFPNKECVYLTSHAEEDLEYYDHNVVYVIGAFLDVMSAKPRPFVRAKQDGVRTLRIPVEKYQKFYASPHKAHRFLTYLKILLEMKRSSSWRDIVTKSVTYPNDNMKKVSRSANLTDKRFKFLVKNYW